MDYLSTILSAIGLLAGGGTVGAIITVYFTRKKIAAEAESTLSGAILLYTNKLTQDIDKLRAVNDKMQGEVDVLQTKLSKARDQLDEAQDRAHKLQEIVTSLELRKENDKVIIDKLLDALKSSDPNNPLISELIRLSVIKGTEIEAHKAQLH